MRYVLTAGALPAGLLLTSAGAILGTPTTLGASSFTVTVIDATAQTSSLATSITVTGVAPTVAGLTNVTIEENRVIPPMTITVADDVTSPDQLTVSVTAGGDTVLGNVSLTGSGSTRTLRLTLAEDREGQATVTLTVPVSDHVAPKSSDVWIEMSAFEIVRSMWTEPDTSYGGKHFQLAITEHNFTFQRDVAAISGEASLDGIYVVRTSVAAGDLDAPTTVRAYKGLSHAERAFRSLKTVDLKIRPIYHWLEDRVRAHVFLCMLAYYVEWHMRERLKPILFDDDQLNQVKRASPVAPAQPSASAEAKRATKITAQGLPVHSFHTLMRDLGTCTLNQTTIALAKPIAANIVARPTPIQANAFNLLAVDPNVATIIEGTIMVIVVMLGAFIALKGRSS